MKYVSSVLGGLILAFLGMMLIGTTFAASADKGANWGVIAFFVFWVVGILMAIGAKSVAKVWRRLFLSSAILSFLMPISGIIYTGSFMAKNVDVKSQYAGAQAAGAAIGGGLVSGFLGFMGFFIGVVFLVIGLLVGREKQIVYVEKGSNSN